METQELSTLQQSAPLDPLEIQRTLDHLWREYRLHQSGVPASRARLANLITYCGTPDEAEVASAAIVRLNSVRPVRSIIVVSHQDETASTDAEAALKCGLTGANRVCYEEIVIHTSEKAAGTLSSVIEPLTVTDLPVYLWFPGDPPLESPGVRRLFELADRVVTDSHTFGDPMMQFRRLHEAMGTLRGRCVFTEMTWTRLGTWREAVGKLFDPVPSREFLPRITDVIITSPHGDGIPSDRSIVMTGWLAARLGWRAVSSEPGKVRFEGSDGPVTVTWLEGPPAARGHLLGVDMKAGEVEFRVRRVHDDPSGAIRSSIICSGDEALGPAYQPLYWETHELLCNALEIRTPFVDWEDALGVIAAIAAL